MMIIIIINILLVFLHYTHRSSTEIAVSKNISYVTTMPSTASRAQAVDTESDTGAATEYSRIDPSYEIIADSNRQQPVASERNQVSASLSEKHEYSEPHLATGGLGGDGGVGQLGETQHEDYSHLQH
jgi:hypothetical protein